MLILEVLGIIVVILIGLGVVLSICLDVLWEVVEKHRKNEGGFLWDILYYILVIIEYFRFWK